MSLRSPDDLPRTDHVGLLSNIYGEGCGVFKNASVPSDRSTRVI